MLYTYFFSLFIFFLCIYGHTLKWAATWGVHQCMLIDHCLFIRHGSGDGTILVIANKSSFPLAMCFNGNACMNGHLIDAGELIS